MKLTEAIQSENWKKEAGIWRNKTTYFCKNRKVNRVKWIKYIEVSCSLCGEYMVQKMGNDKKYKRAYCSDECRKRAIKKHYIGLNHMSYKGGKYIHEGYVRIKCYGHHMADKNGYVSEHVLVAENIAGRKLEANEVVHHKDENRSNNNPSNLQIMLDVEHKRYHAKKNKLGQKK